MFLNMDGGQLINSVQSDNPVSGRPHRGHTLFPCQDSLWIDYGWNSSDWWNPQLRLIECDNCIYRQYQGNIYQPCVTISEMQFYHPLLSGLGSRMWQHFLIAMQRLIVQCDPHILTFVTQPLIFWDRMSCLIWNIIWHEESSTCKITSEIMWTLEKYERKVYILDLQVSWMIH